MLEPEALIGDRLTNAYVDSTLAEYSPDAGRSPEITWPPHIEENRTLAIREPVEARNDALIAIPVDPALGREPIRAILATCA
jgi:hypothetical protein